MKNSGELQSVSAISYRVEGMFEVPIEECLGVEALVEMIMNFERDDIEYYGSLVAALERNEYRSKPDKLELDMKHRESPPTRLSIEEEIQDLPPNLRYVFFGKYDTLPVIIASYLNVHQV